jgi:hypothetical protein
LACVPKTAAAALNEPAPETTDEEDNNGVPRVSRFFQYQAEYDVFRERFNAVIEEHIPRRYRNLSFREMVKLTEFNLKYPLKQIDCKTNFFLKYNLIVYLL